MDPGKVPGPRECEAYTQEVGWRLRMVRRQRHLSLAQVELASARRIKGSVLGAYERGERGLAVARLWMLSVFYGIPITQFLPQQERMIGNGAGASRRPAATLLPAPIMALRGPEAKRLQRFVGMIQAQNHDFDAVVLPIYPGELRTLACMLEIKPDQAVERLREVGALESP